MPSEIMAVHTGCYTATNEHQGYLLGSKDGQGVGLTTLPPSCADCLEILGVSTSWSPKGPYKYEGWNFNSGNYLFTADTK